MSESFYFVAMSFWLILNLGFHSTVAEDITAPDRFLMIATSGGLNQQRTGVILVALY